MDFCSVTDHRITMATDNQISRAKYRFLLVCGLAAFIATLDASIVNVCLPTLSRTFDVSVDIVAWVVLAYALTITATLLVVGRMATKNGYRPIYLIGFGLFAAGSLACALSSSITQLTAARVLQGVGASFLIASGPALITRAFPPTERGQALGMLGTIVGLGLMTGPPLGGMIVSAFGWHWIFLINIPICLFALYFTRRTLRDLVPEQPDSRIDYLGGIFQGMGVVLILLFFNRLNNPDWPAPVLYAVLGLSMASFAAFIWREVSTDHPLLGLSLFTHKRYTIAISTMMLTFVASSAALVLIPFYLEEILHLHPHQVGLVLVTIPLCTLIIAPLSGRLSDAIGDRVLTTIGLIILIIGMFWVAGLDQFSDRIDVVMRLAVIGIGLGIFQAPNSSAMMSAAPNDLVGIASSVLAVARNLGMAGGVAVATAVFAFRHDLYLKTVDSTAAFVHSYQWVVTAFGFLAIVALAISLLRMGIPAKRA